MDNRLKFDKNSDLFNMFLKLLNNDQDKELLLMLIQNKSDQAVYELILEKLRKEE